MSGLHRAPRRRPPPSHRDRSSSGSRSVRFRGEFGSTTSHSAAGAASRASLRESDDAGVGLAPKCQSRAESGSSCVGVPEARQPGPPRRAGMRYRGRHQLRPGGVRRVRDWDDADTVPELQEGGAGASRGRTRGRAVVPGGARSYLRPSLTYDLTQEGTTVRWGVRPRAGMYDRVPGRTTARSRAPANTAPDEKLSSDDSRDPDAPDHLARPTHPGSTHGFKVTDGRPTAGRAHSDITRSRPAREAGSRPLSAHPDGPESTESAESPAFRSDTRIVPHDPDRTPEREKPGVRLDAWLRPLAPAAPPAPRCAYSTRSPSALSRARSGPRSCGSPGRPRAPTCCAPRTQWSPPDRGPRSPRRRRPTPAGRSAPRRARD